MLGGGVAVAALLVVTVCATTTATGGAEEPKRSVLRSASRAPFVDDASPTDEVATVLVIRHCDKDPESNSPHCTPRGYRRAAWLPTLFGDRGDERFRAPSYVFARRPESNKKKKRPVVRSVETVTPLAETFDVAIDDTYGVDTERDLSTRVKEMVRDGDLTGGLAVVCWKHEQIPQLAYDLGWHTSSKKRTKWKADDYDSIIELTYTRWTDGYWRVDGKREHEDFHDTPPV